MLACQVDNNICPILPAKKQVTKQPEKEWRGYPLRRGYWSGCSGWQHLASGQHMGKFNIEWLKTLSYNEIQSLHSDDHEGRVNWSYAIRGDGKSNYTPSYSRRFRWR